MITQWGSLNTPISFFSPPKLKPVLPPTEASTIERRVVGILMKLMPRLKVLAAKPPRSVTIPPPRLMRSEWRVAPPFCSSCHTWLTLSRVFERSEEGMQTLSISPLKGEDASAAWNIGRQYFSVLVSVSTKILSCSHSLMAVVSSAPKSLEIIILGFMLSFYLHISTQSLSCRALAYEPFITPWLIMEKARCLPPEVVQ